MDLRETLIFLGFSTLAGALAFNLIVIFLFRSGLVFSARDQQGHLKKQIPLSGILSMAGFLTLVVGFIVLTNYIGLAARNITLRFWPLFFLNLILILALILYDSLVIDWLVIGRWRPGFLRLPDVMDASEMTSHIRKTLIAGPIFGTLIALVSTLISYSLWMSL